VAIGLVGAAYVLSGGFHFGAASSTVLVHKGTYYSLPGGQFNALAFSVSKASVLNGTFTNTYGINLYTMTPSELVSLAKTGVVGGFAWSSGRIANLTVTNLNLDVAAGQWDLVFLNADNPSPLNTTIVGFYTDLTVGPT